ncbi:MAG: OmpH family outer membrane protein, partial [bacterium]
KVDSMKDELQALEEKIKSPVISEKAQSELKDQYRKKQAELIEFVTQAKEEEERENQVLSARILDGLIDIAREIAEKEKYTIILEKTGGAVLYFEEGLDLTEQAVKIYNERFQAEKNQ